MEHVSSASWTNYFRFHYKSDKHEWKLVLALFVCTNTLALLHHILIKRHWKTLLELPGPVPGNSLMKSLLEILKLLSELL